MAARRSLPERLRLSAAGLRIRIDVPDTVVLEEVARRLPPPARDTRGRSFDAIWNLEAVPGEPVFRVRREGHRSGRPLPLAAAIDRLAFDVQVFLASEARDCGFFHAGAVSWKGRALLLPGRSFSGKSTLVAALLRAGASYLSDEIAIVDVSGNVHSYARPLAMRRGAGDTERVAPEALSARTARGGKPIAAILFLSFRPGKALQLKRLTRGEAALGLLSHALAARSRPQASLGVARAATSRAVAYRGSRGEAEDAVASLIALAGE